MDRSARATSVARGFASCALFVLVAALPASADRAEAEKLIAEGQAAMNQGQWSKGLDLYSRAVEADPTWPESLAYRGQAKIQMGDTLSAIDDYSRCLELDAKRKPGDPTTVRDVKNLRATAYVTLDRLDEALEDVEWVLKFEPTNQMGRFRYADTLGGMGQIDRALEEVAKLDPKALWTILEKLNLIERKGDWSALEKEALALTDPGMMATSVMYQTRALTAQGRLKEAEDLARGAWKKYESSHTSMSLLHILSTPGAPGFSPDATLDWFRKLIEKLPPQHEFLAEETRTLVLAGRTREAIELASTRTTFAAFETYFWLAVALWKQDRAADAIEAFRQARRRNEYLMKYAELVPGLPEFLKSLQGELAGEAKGGGGQIRVDVAVRQASRAEIDARVRRFDFARAAADYRKLRGALTTERLQAEIDARALDLDGMAAALKRVVTTVNAAKPPLQVTVSGNLFDIVKADATAFDFKFAKGSGKQPWASLESGEFARLALACKLPPEEQYALGVLIWDSGDASGAAKVLDAAATALPDLRARLAALVSVRRGIPAPPNGFALFRGSWVTADERANLEKGLVRFEGEWLTAADAEKLGRGLKKNGEAWVTEADAALIARGFRKEGDKWMSPQEYVEFHSQWKNAWVQETAHYTIRTTQGEAFAKDLADLVEVAYVEFKKFWGGRDPKLGQNEKMILFAYRDFEDYRKYCVERKAEKMLNAAGFANVDSRTVAGWNKLEDLPSFLETMVHEAAHLYYWRAIGYSDPPSWLSEGMATWFEGFEWTGKNWKFTHVAPNRQFFARQAILKGLWTPLANLAKQDAAKLINEDFDKSIAFYAECWSLNAFLTQTDNPAYLKAYEAYRKDAERGHTDPLEKYFTNLKQLESDCKRFVTGK